MPSEIREALNAANAAALVAKVIDPVLLEYQRRYSPLVTALPRQKWGTDQYYFNQRTQVARGGFVTDGGAQPVSQSTYVQNNFQMKHLEVVGAITGYAQEVTRQVIGDLLQTEIQGSIQGLTWDTENGIVWGNAGSTLGGAQPQFDGLDTLVSQFTGSNQNSLDQGNNTFTLAMLDELIDMVEQNAAMDVLNSNWMFVCSSTLISKVAQLLLNQQRYESVEVATGLIVPTYRNIPFIKTSFLSARSFSMGTVTSTTATTGGSLPASSTYKYVVSPVIARQGEIQPSAEVTQATGSGTATNIITLAFSTPSGLEGSQPTLYKVYRTAAGGAGGSETFLGYVDATVGLAADGITPIATTSIVDTGVALIPQNGSTVPASPPAAYVGTNTGLLPPATKSENVFLISRDRNNVVRPYVREMQPITLYPTTTSPDQMPYALVTDNCLAVRAPKYTGRLARVNVAV